MAQFNYSQLKAIAPLSNVSASVFTNSAATASYVRTVYVYAVTSSNQTLNMWSVPNGAAVGNHNKILQYQLSGSTSFMIEFGIPGIILNTSGDSIWASTTDMSGSNIMIMGGIE